MKNQSLKPYLSNEKEKKQYLPVFLDETWTFVLRTRFAHISQ